MFDAKISFISLARPVVAVVFMSTLIGCGGGGSSTPSVTTPPTTPDTGGPNSPSEPRGPETEAQMLQNHAALRNDYDPSQYTALNTIPTTGSATYQGYLTGDLANRSDAITNEMIGQLDMAVNFNAQSVGVTGTVTNFVDADDRGITGSLTLSQGALDRAGNPASDPTLRIRATGTLTDHADRDLAMSLYLEGDFLGSTYGAVGGDALGAVTVNGVEQDFDGSFIAER